MTALLHTRDGYLWVGTEKGLARFDGLRFAVFEKSNSPELKSNRITALLEDRVGDLWIGTAGGGLTRYHKGHFRNFSVSDGLLDSSVRCLLEDRRGDIWIGTAAHGLNRLHQDSFSNYRFSPYTTREGLPINQVLSLGETADGSLWVGTTQGLARWSHQRFTILQTKDGLPSNVIGALLPTDDGGIWAGTDAGLSYVTRAGNDFLLDASKLAEPRAQLGRVKITSLYLGTNPDVKGHGGEILWVGTESAGVVGLEPGRSVVQNAKSGLATNNATALLTEANGDLWLGTTGAGLVRIAGQRLFDTYDVTRGLSTNVALSVYGDRQGAIWVGTNGSGINRLDGKRSTIVPPTQALIGATVFTICEGNDGSMWYGTQKGLIRVKKGKQTVYTVKDGLAGNEVLASLMTSNGVLWFGTRTGLSSWSDGKFKSYNYNNGLSSDYVQALYEDREHRLWIGTRGGGLNLLEDGHFHSFDVRQGLSNDAVFSILEDHSGNLWVGTDGGGINRFRNGHFASFTMRDGFPDDVVFQILEDNFHALWVSSNRGVFRVPLQSLNEYADHRSTHIQSMAFGTTDGMGSRECNGSFQPAGWKARDGHLWFPTMQGVVTVDPAKVAGREEQQSTVIEQVLLDGQEIPAGSSFSVPAGTGNLEIHYTAPNFHNPRRINFQYELVNFDRGWVHAGTRRAAYYTNIPPGRYRFVVTASNRDMTWSTRAASLGVKLEPHLYQTWYFYLLCVLTLIGLSGAAHIARIRQLRAREKELAFYVNERTSDLQREVVDREAAQAEAVRAREAAERASMVKSEFVANMSHEIRTPMNGIVGMTQLVLGTELSMRQRQYLEVIKESADSLLVVIDDILDFSKVEAGKLELNYVDFNLRECLSAIVRSVAYRADQKGVRLLLNLDERLPMAIHCDPIRLRQIVLNLIGNALKFTDQGEVSLSAELEAENDGTVTLLLTVRDTGIGIPQDKLTLIFDAFSQADSSTTRRFGGTGLGLAICNRLARLLGAKIWATSEVGKGSQFFFRLKAQVATLTAAAPTETEADEQSLHRESLQALANSVRADFPILIAEDNPANRLVARYTLEEAGFQVSEVSNGLEAVRALQARRYSLVLMDCRMPIMDGYEATRQIRALPSAASTIPIIALTASAYQEDREHALSAGMNDFVTKPFEDRQIIDRCVHWLKASAKSRSVEQMPAPEQIRPAEEKRMVAGWPEEATRRYSIEFLRGMLELFLETAPPVYENLIRGLDEADWELARTSAHWLRGGAIRMFGQCLQGSLTRIEEACRSEEPFRARADRDEVSEAFAVTRKFAEDWLAQNHLAALG